MLMNNKLSAVIIDDEERARRVLIKMIKKFCPDIRLVETNACVPNEVFEIQPKKPDVVFLDIEMPDYSVLDFFSEAIFEIIFVTTYSRYDFKAFKVPTIDSPFKPIQIDDLESAIHQLKSKLHLTAMEDRFDTLKVNLKVNLKSKQLQKISIPVSNGFIFVKVDDISHINADGSYSKIWLKNGSNTLVSKRLKYFEELLKGHTNFYRAHRSHLLDCHFIKKYNRHENLITLENGEVIKVARERKVQFEEYCRSLSTPNN